MYKQAERCVLNYVSTDELTTELMILSETNSPQQ